MTNIKEMRERAGLTQAKVAAALDISTDTLWRWETHAGEPRASDLIKMSQLFGCAVNELLDVNPTQPLSEAAAEQGEREAV